MYVSILTVRTPFCFAWFSIRRHGQYLCMRRHINFDMLFDREGICAL